MKLTNYVAIFGLLFTTQLLANQSTKNLETQRVESIQRYLASLKNADAAKIIKLFTSNATVISTSKGRVEPAKFFNSFLPALKSADVKVFTIYKGDLDHYAARFHFAWTEKDNQTGSGNYMDDFKFAKNSAKLENVFMFENKTLEKE